MLFCYYTRSSTTAYEERNICDLVNVLLFRIRQNRLNRVSSLSVLYAVGWRHGQVAEVRSITPLGLRKR